MKKSVEYLEGTSEAPRASDSDRDSIESDDSHNYLSERGFLSSCLAVIGLSSICNGSVLDGLAILSTITVFWQDELSNCLNNFLRDDTCSESKHAFNLKVAKLAKRMVHLPAADLSEYDPQQYQDLADSDTREHLFKYMESVLEDCGYNATVDALKQVDPRIHLRAVDEGYIPMTRAGDVILDVYIKDSAWMGVPTANTMIVGVDGYTDPDDSTEEEFSESEQDVLIL